MHTIERVAEFHDVFGHPVRLAPNCPSKAERLLRFRLIFEELLEFGRAIGIEGLAGIEQEAFEHLVKEAVSTFTIDEDAGVNLIEAADALGDLDYVVQGSNLVFGFPAEAVVAEIHRANMSKLGEDGRPVLREDGKITKGPNYKAPDVGSVLLAATATAPK